MPPPQPPPPDPVTQMNTYRSYVTMLADPNSKDELKLKAAQELSENFEVIMCSSQYPAFLDHMMKIFIKILQDGEPHFISEYNIQQVRKLILEMIHRLPTNEHLRPYVKPILSLMLKLLETENEENILVCLRIIIELHKQYRPTFNPEIQHFLQFVKSIYSELPKNLNKIFEPRPPIRVKDLSELNIEVLLRETFTITPIQSEKKASDGNLITYNLIPRAVLSLKVLQELPIIVVLMYQIYKQNVHQDVADFIPLIMTTITLQPSLQHRNAPGFNKEVFVDFMGAQIKTISFLAYIIRIYQDVVSSHSTMMVKGMLGLLTLCPIEVTHLRRELLIAARHILATDLRIKFVPYMERLFDEQVLLGNGWTTYESLRPLAYSTLADLVHHVRQLLQLPDLARAVHLFSKNVHDQSLPTTIQTMSCKLLLNLVECIRTRSDSDNSNQGRELLMRMLEVFVLKFKTITKLQLPILLNKANNAKAIAAAAGSGAGTAAATGTGTGATIDIKTEDSKPPILQETDDKEANKSKFLTPQNQSSSLVNCNVSDYRSLIKTLVCGVKTITWGCANCKSTNSSGDVIQSKQFHPRETLVFIRLVKWALQALDIYTIGPLMANPTLSTQQHHYHMRAGQAQPPPPQTVRTKEEKEVLEHFSGVFSMMNPQTFQEIFSTTIDYMVERIFRNGALQIVGNSFLANPTTSPIFATVLVEYLLERMDDMGSNLERSNLYLRLFKLVFGSVSLFPAENEHMLRPHLHQIVTRSMELAMSAKEPYNYFLLLRALFRSIGGGSHDLLYQEFLPLLPNLLEGLNRLQSGLHKQHMKDLFVELCLTVPVRLSSLLPYLPMLMDPLVSALNGSHNLVSQGLRTLELCVDNLQPDFLYEHIQPVRADLMQALWRTLRNPNDQVAHVAFRVLGKFGGGNRKMMIEPQRLDYNDRDNGLNGNESPAVVIYFPDSATTPVKLPIEMIIETAFTALKSNTTDSFYRKQCWQVINCYLASVLQLNTEINPDNTDVTDETTRQTLHKLFTSTSFKENNLPSLQQQQQSQSQELNYKYDNVVARNVLQTALTGLFVAAAIKELKQSVIATMVSLVRHYTIIAIAQQAGPYCLAPGDRLINGSSGYTNRCQDPLVLMDALATIMGHEEKELCKPGQLALILILETATQILGSKERACQLPMMEYLAEKMCALCYERAWYAKLGGCIAIKFLFERMATKWVLQHLFQFLKALMYVMMDLTGKVSNGAIDMAKENLEQMLRVYVHPDIINSTPELLEVQNKSIYDVTHELVRQVTSPHTLVREQAMSSLRLLAEIQNKSVTQVMEPHKDVLADMIPPKKHLLRHQPANAQIGLMDGNTFCTTLTPRLFTIDLQIHEHKVFFQELLGLCDNEDAFLHKLPCYKSVSNLIPLRKSALRALAACHYIVGLRDKIFSTLYRTFERPNPELQQATFECMQKFIGGFQIDMETVHTTMRPMLLTLGDHRNLSLNCVKRLSYLTQLFPSTFSITLCEQLLLHLKKLLENLIQTSQANQQHKTTASNIKFDDDCKEKISLIIGIFHLIPAATPKFIDVLCRLVLQTEKSLLIEASSPFRRPLMKFLLRYPTETLTLFLHDNNIKEQQWSRYLEYLIKQPTDGKPFRDVLFTNMNCTGRLITMLLAATVSNSSLSTSLATSSTSGNLTTSDKYELQHQAIRIISVLIKFDEQWLSTQGQIVAALKQLWYQDGYLELHKRVENVDFSRWKEPKLVVKILLHYFSHHPTDIDLLFQLLRATCDRFIPDFQFLRDFLENTVAREYQVEWKRSAFFRFVEHSCPQGSTSASATVPASAPTLSEELRAKILQLIIIPAFAVSFERGEGVKLVGGAPMPYQDNPENVVSVFISRVIDPDNPFASADCLRISLLQFSCLLVEQASQHIHDVTNKRQGNKLRRLMTFAWPCLLGKNCVDPATRYHGHLLLSHIIAKFAIHKRIVLQVFHSLLKAHAVEARNVVRQALEILTPAMPVRMEDGNTMLTHWTKKIIVEEGHSMQQLIHILQLVVRHYKVYYPVRHHLVQHMVNSIQRLGFSPNATLDNRRLAVELAEVIIKWELHRIKDEAAGQMMDTSDPNLTLNELMANPVNRFPGEPSATKPIERGHADSILNFLLRLACQVNDGTTSIATAAGAANASGAATSTATPAATAAAIQSSGNPGELLSRRCVNLLKMALKPDVWPSSTQQQQQPPPDLKLNWLDKVFASIDSAQPNYGNICTALELLTFLLGVMKREQILANFKLLQRGLSACLTSNNTKVIRLMHALMSRLMSIFPTESTVPSGVAPPASKYDELNTLYTAVANFITEGLTAYEKNTGLLSNTTGAAAGNASTSLFGTLMILKAACINNSSYIDRFISQFGRVLHRMTKDHLQLSGTVTADAATSNTITDSNPVNSELLILSLDLVKNRVAVMSPDMRKSFISSILIILIEKTHDIKIMKAITRMLEEWMKNKNPIAVNQAPSLKEKSMLLVKMMQCVEKKFPDDQELNGQFLELVNYVYRDEILRTTDLTSKLEPAFLSGLRCTQPSIRAKFFEVFDSSMRRRLYDRLLYIICSQSWDAMGPHYWIKQCIELVIVTASASTPMKLANQDNLLPSLSTNTNTSKPASTSLIPDEADLFFTRIKKEPGLDDDIVDDFAGNLDSLVSIVKDDLLDMDLGTISADISMEIDKKPVVEPTETINQLINKQDEFLQNARKVKTEQFLLAAAQLCHMDTSLAERVWLDIFPRLWSILDETQHSALTAEIVPFVCSGAHVIQKDCHPSAIATFVEAISHCDPPVPIRPPLIKYLGRSHNLWHRMTLTLEKMAFENGDLNGTNDTSSVNANSNSTVNANSSSLFSDKRELIPTQSAFDCYDFEPADAVTAANNPHAQILDSLADMYSLLCEEDMWCGLWQKHAHYKETIQATSLEQQGFFEQAQVAYDAAMTKFKQDYIGNPAPFKIQRETLLWEQHWIRCAKELNQWDLLLDYGSKKTEKNPFLILESSWRIPNWTMMKEALAQVEHNCPKEMAWRVNLYRGFLAICHNEDQHLNTVERYVELASSLCMREWRRLPAIVSHIHLPLLQAAQQIMELQEAMQIHQGLLHGRSTASSLHDMKAIVKTWRNRLPVIADDLSHWSDIFTWRQHHYTFISSHYDSQQQQQQDPANAQSTTAATPTTTTNNHSMLGVHASAQAIIHFGKIARKHNLTGVCLDSLSRIYTIPSVPIVDCFQKIRQQVKCYLQMAAVSGNNELQEGLEVIESTNLKYFTKEMTAEFYALKGMLLSQIGRSDDANKAFSAAVQLHDTLVKAWALWGDYLEQIFTRDSRQQIAIGVSAITCFLHACRHQNESKSRKYLAKVLWLLTYDDDKNSLMEAVDKYAVGVPPIQWLPWIPQLLMCLIRHEGNVILNLLSQVGRMFPQAVYFSIRTLYLTLKIEQRERYKSAELQQQQSSSSANINPSQATPASAAETGPIKATAPMWRCSKIMHMQRDIHPTILSSLEGIVDQMVWLRETWYEEVLRQLRQGLAKCHAIAYENRGAVSEATITPHTLNFVKKLVSTFGIGIENISSTSSQTTPQTFGSAASESLARRAQATVQDPVFQRMKEQFSSDFDFTVPGAKLLHNLINKLKKWIKILESKTRQLPKSFLIEEKCRFLSNFSLKTAEVELPGEFLLPKPSHYYVRIARFMPRVEVVQRHNTAARRLRIRGHNGRLYPYLVVNDAGLGDARREERVLQLLRMLNYYLAKQKETSRRFLHFTVPRVVAVSPQMRLVEDNPASTSLLDIYKLGCAKMSGTGAANASGGMEHDAPIARYYEKLAVMQAKGTQASHQMLRDILKHIQSTMVPRTMMKSWAVKTFPVATDYWTFRKMFTLQLALACFAEYVLHLTRLNPDMMYIHQDSGLVNIAYFKFDVDDMSGELDAQRPVPFRLTPNILEFITTTGVSGPLTASAIAIARCLVHPSFKVHTILRAILRDEVIADHNRKQEDAENAAQAPADMKGELLITMVTRAVTAIMTRLNSLANFADNGDGNKVSTLVAAASSHDNLCRMDPSWHPWL
ncbi:transformation/transcription domain-associated protein [Microplitis demolitor]|uniref:transformation/transcription domain-associated protein n=1 Tax=Microplitis demolitor TaxID=69319 RepID=UPI0004CD29E4|nr:transformation/transcription domain-associated protein [Microplitis demolitor]